MNQKSVLVDANILIAVIDGKDDNPNHTVSSRKTA